MTEDTGGPMDTSGVDVAAAVADMRRRIDGFGESISAMRGEADRLLASASGRVVVAVLEPPAQLTGSVVDAIDDTPPSLESFGAGADGVGAADRNDDAPPERGRHAAGDAPDFDPRPFDPDDDVDEPVVVGRHGDTGVSDVESLAAAPAFEPELADPESLPAFEVKERPDTFAAPRPGDVLSPESPEAAGPEQSAPAEADEDGPGATVLEFTPRSLAEPGAGLAFGAVAPEPAEAAPAAPASAAEPDPTPQADAAPAFGALPDPPPAATPPADGLDAIADSESTDVPVDWENPGSDDAAFDKFFSSDVEPEPAQRWLLNE